MLFDLNAVVTYLVFCDQSVEDLGRARRVVGAYHEVFDRNAGVLGSVLDAFPGLPRVDRHTHRHHHGH